MQIQRLLPAICAVLLLPGCVGFQQKWLAAQIEHKPPHEDIQGAWIGSWTSGHNGHNGKLRCVITKTGQGRYEFFYWATWARVISGGFTIECEVEETDGQYQFTGDMDLGKLGGEFTHEGKGSGEVLEATWRARSGDHGTFELRRPDTEE